MDINILAPKVGAFQMGSETQNGCNDLITFQ
jgi:hypothetical protein